eukprot:TRINITY_DN19021_c0_g1_i1.p1 TRINITY_DN19021_c0_g1~~TRINITY_DN19021_c0_g1_i1.p1  ORF type:complete len:113 (-),score=34.03 TRINITY_DN19021_c0_g1_i1:92-430(-)
MCVCGNGRATVLSRKRMREAAGKAAPDLDMKNMATMMFSMMDKDKDGILTRSEMAPEDGKMPQDQAEKMFEQMDIDKDGAVSRAEADKVFADMNKMMQMMPGGPGGGQKPEL